jgi:ABC-type transport system involved in Fe-S cluster assembly fused permease/ATPase subunit
MLIIAHRLSTIIHADQILCKVQERGTQSELLALNRKYASMWRKENESKTKTQTGLSSGCDE